MRILDGNGTELAQPDPMLGRLEPEQRFVAHHEAIAAVEEQGHYEVVAEYDNGGKDVVWVVDVPGVEAADAWDEYEDILRYVPFTAEELAQRGAAAQAEMSTEDLLLEMAGDHEYRLCLLELGVTGDDL